MILEEIAARTVQRVAEEKAAVPLSEMKKRAEALDANTDFPFRKALSGDEISFICEVKRASPSKGLIAPDFPYLDIARDYERAGASAISCLTEPFWFKGRDEFVHCEGFHEICYHAFLFGKLLCEFLGLFTVSTGLFFDLPEDRIKLFSHI